jgi:VWFA-related protein
MTPARVWLCLLGIGLLSSIALTAADPARNPEGAQAGTTTAPQPQQPSFRVGVDVVRIDAVVTDKDGNVVPDLTAADFEVRQDGKVQPLTLARFYPVADARPRSGGATSNAAASAASQVLPAIEPLPAPLTRDQVQRSIVLVVDDLGMSVESLYYAKRGLDQFIDRDVQPRDLMAIVRTSAPGGVLKPFTSDRRLLHAQVDGLHWNGFSRSHVEPFESVQSLLDTSVPGGGQAAVQPDDFTLFNHMRQYMSAAGTLGAMNLLLRHSRDLPGRRVMILLSEGFQIMETDHLDAAWTPEPRTRAALDRVFEQATRAGVVIYSVDVRGLQTGRLLASDNAKGLQASWQAPENSQAVKAGDDRRRMLLDTEDSLRYVAEQTGGFAVLSTNDLGRGLERVLDDVKSYYILGYSPPEGTFAAEGKTPRYHRLSVRVKRPGLTVKTRKEFLGFREPPEAAPATPAEVLQHAALSPFATSEIPIKATALPGYSPTAGAFVRALLYIDARGLSYEPDATGRRTASVDVMGIAVDDQGTGVAQLSTGFSVALADKVDQAELERGLVYVLRVPIPKPGAYQVRFAVRDQRSGAVGSTGQFVQLGDVAHGDFALSGIVVGEDHRTADARIAEGLDTAGLLRQQARRVFEPGSQLSFAYEVYNADAPVEATASVWRGDEKVFTTMADRLAPPATDVSRFAAAGGLKLGTALPPGRYVLQVDARTKPGSGRKKSASERIDFEVR